MKNLAKDKVVKLTIPAPSQIYQDLLVTAGDAVERSSVYSSYEDVERVLVNAYKEFLDEYSKLDSSIIQLDDCVWAGFASDETFQSSPNKGLDRLETMHLYLDMNNEVADHARSLGLKVYGHNCRGNYATHAAMKGTYEATDLFLKNLRYDRFYLEWDDDRAGSLRVLEVFKDRDVEVVVGALSSKNAQLDDESRALQILEDASKYIDKIGYIFPINVVLHHVM